MTTASFGAWLGEKPPSQPADPNRPQAKALPRPPRASAALRRVYFGVSSLAGDFNGSGSVQGSLYPPTPSQVRRLAELKAQLGGDR